MRQFYVLYFFACISSAASADLNLGNKKEAAGDNFFDPSLFKGARFSDAAIRWLTVGEEQAEGLYKVDVYINGSYITESIIQFSEYNGRVQPCIIPELAEKLDIILDKDRNLKCLFVAEEFDNSSAKLDVSVLRLDIVVPNDRLKKKPRGYVNQNELTQGDSVLFMNYIANYYHVNYSSENNPNLDSAWLSLNSGLNIGGWQYRQLSTLSWTKDAQNWDRIRSYVQRPIPAIGSQLNAGELISSGKFFSGLNYKGLNLYSDDRMLPDSVRGYAPVINGVATSNAKVVVRQGGNQIYQTTVSAGPFEINDLYPTSYNGDLEVEVTEADGSIKRFTVPFSAVPESIRPGTMRYNLALGKTYETSTEDTPFGDFTLQYGISNNLTINSGLRIADGYQSLVLGSVLGSHVGAFGFDVTYSNANLPEDGYTDGWMSHLSYSKTFQPTNTTIALAGYRYSTEGYRDLGDVIGVRKAYGNGYTWSSDSYKRLNRVELSLSQSLYEYGNIYLSGAIQNYRGGVGQNTEVQLGYNKSFSNGMSFGLTVGKQRTSTIRSVANDQGSTDETITTLSLSIPFGNSTSTNYTYTKSSSSKAQMQSSISGATGENNDISYSAGILHMEESNTNVFTGSLHKRTSEANIGANFSKSDNYWQASANAQGAIAVHLGGVTTGPYLGDTFALVEAKGAEGAQVFNSQNTTIDSRGYALVPSMNPYKYNRITLNPENMRGDADIIDSEQKIAPVAGAAIKIKFKTRSGKALLITGVADDGRVVPLGSDVLDEKGNIIGMVGQSGQMYLRTENSSGELTIKWGDETNESCKIEYNVDESLKNSSVIKLNEICRL